jgi:hypothetical protein
MSFSDTTEADLEVPDQEPVAADFDREEVLTNAKGDLSFLAGLCAPEVVKYFFPALILAVWNLLTEAAQKPRGVLQLALGLPRGFAKTFILKIYVIYLILFTNRNFILVVCNTEQLAMNFLSDVCDILSSANITMIFGDWTLGREKDTQALKKFSFRGRDIIFAGIGVGTSMRGLNLKLRRPDCIIMDDMQSREDAEAKAIADKQLIWMMGTLMKARNYERCLFVFLGNMYPFEGCILRKLKYNRQWVSFITGAILEDGTSLWEEMRPLKELLEELENDIAMGHPEVFYSEVLNDEEAGTVSGIDTSKIPQYPPNLNNVEPQGGFILIDPATGKKTGDDVSIGLFLIYDGTPVLHQLKVGKFSPGECIQHTLIMALSFGIKIVVVESNAYQFTYLYWWNFVCRQMNIDGIDCLELYSGAFSKNSRIKTMFPRLLKGELLLHPTVRPIVIHQIVHWNPLRTANVDDILDILAYCYKAIELYGPMMELTGGMPALDHQTPPALSEEEIAEQLSF